MERQGDAMVAGTREEGGSGKDNTGTGGDGRMAEGVAGDRDRSSITTLLAVLGCGGAEDTGGIGMKKELSSLSSSLKYLVFRAVPGAQPE
jgi:hypothetical protein